MNDTKAKELITRLCDKYNIDIVREGSEEWKTKKQLKKIKTKNDALRSQIAALEKIHSMHPIRNAIARFWGWLKNLFTKKKPLGVLREHFLTRFAQTVEYYQNDYLTDEDIELLAENEDTAPITVAKIKSMQIKNKARENYVSLVNSNKSLLQETVRKYKEQILILENELNHVQKLKFTEPEDITKHNTRLATLRTRIETDKATLEKLLYIPEKQKNKPGRPAKQKPNQPENNNLAPEEQAALEVKKPNRKTKAKKKAKPKAQANARKGGDA